MPTLRPRPITVKEVEALSKRPGRHSVGDGLILVAGATTRGCSWTCRLRTPSGKRRDMGLGPYPEVSLGEARQRAADLRRLVRDGLDPLEERRRARRRLITFAAASEQCWEARKAGFKNGKHVDQWISTLRTYVHPVFGDKPIADVTHIDATAALRPIWLTKKETARRVLQRIGDVCSWAIGQGLRDAELPRTVIRDALGKQNKKVKHHPAVPIEAAPAVFKGLMDATSVGGYALAFQILTALRPGVGRTALWSEIDFEHELWTIPGERMKCHEELVVPLPQEAIVILNLMKGAQEDAELETPFVFPSPTAPAKKAISDTTQRKVQIGSIEGFTLHGWRSTFEDWAAEYTDFPQHVVDAAMAHVLDDDVKAAYRRTTFLDQRQKLMQAWADFLEGRMEIKQGLDAVHRARKRAAK